MAILMTETWLTTFTMRMFLSSFAGLVFFQILFLQHGTSCGIIWGQEYSPHYAPSRDYGYRSKQEMGCVQFERVPKGEIVIIISDHMLISYHYQFLGLKRQLSH